MKCYIILLLLLQVAVVLCPYARLVQVFVEASYFTRFPRWLNVTIFYNSRCNITAKFFAGQLLPIWLKYKKYVGLELVPFGNSTLIETPLDPFMNWIKFEFISQLGEDDCLYNKLHACILKYPKELLKMASPQSELKQRLTHSQLMLITCLMSYENQIDSLQKCAYEYTHNEINALKECTRASESSYYLADHGRRTSLFFPPMRHFPFIVMNNTHRSYFSRRALLNLEYVICAHLPKICRMMITTTTVKGPLTGHWFIT